MGEIVGNPDTRTSVSRKILALALSFALPIGVLAWLMVANINSNISFAEKETRGISYLRPLNALLSGGVEHWLARRHCAEAGGCAGSLDTIAREMENHFNLLEQAQSRHGETLQFTPAGLALRNRQDFTVEKARAQWNDLRAAPADDPAIRERYENLFTTLRTMITHAGDTSNLILDPDLDSYYLMDVVLLGLPQTEQRVGQISDLGLRYFEEPRRGAPGDVGLAVQAALLQQADLDRIVLSSRTALNEDANFFGRSKTLGVNLTPALERYEQASARLVQLTGAMAADEPADVSQFLAASREVRQANAAYWSVAADELESLLLNRIASFREKRLWALSLSGLALLVAGVLAYWLARSITLPLQGLVESLGPGATLLSVCVDRIAAASAGKFADADEAVIICEELRSHADAMRGAVAELTSQVHGSAGPARHSGIAAAQPQAA